MHGSAFGAAVHDHDAPPGAERRATAADPAVQSAK